MRSLSTRVPAKQTFKRRRKATRIFFCSLVLYMLVRRAYICMDVGNLCFVSMFVCVYLCAIVIHLLVFVIVVFASESSFAKNICSTNSTHQLKQMPNFCRNTKRFSKKLNNRTGPFLFSFLLVEQNVYILKTKIANTFIFFTIYCY